ncbi:Cadmium-transporting ATPase [Sporomusa sphaeroides DSM 2875]|uniref:Copper-exporting P-type ATPase n=1 Tax=Sporomusa sphaeroides DSM 2875 TaxID=1337886 RepID=A0ABM9W797_9FIRM|nr:heavy metal translocating P-type ATPase [Sporomusa sphaeroides]OLS54496.1 putative cadmium-transporting ATPase [Sporomusa sphaeroides DSM 2875]CVK21033.1 putative cadmium-transporting ATPase [Sporomusa sphaeroides DSM 2875]
MEKQDDIHCGCGCCGGEAAAAVSEGGVAALGSDKLIQATFLVDGLDCADCAAKVEKAVRRLTGVVDAQMNFAAAKLKVNYDAARLADVDIENVITGFGYRVGVSPAAQAAPGYQKTVFRISGLDCADCAAKLEKRVAAVSGVRAVQLNFGTGNMAVEHSCQIREIIQAVEQAGYEAVEGSEPAAAAVDKQAWWLKPRMLATLVSGVLVAGGMVMDWMAVNEQATITTYVLAMLIGGYHVAKSGLYGLKSMTMDTNFLMVIAVTGAAAIGEWSEGATVVFLFSLGNALQAYTLDKTRDSIRALMELAPREALVKRDGEELRLPVEAIVVGDIIIVKPGERIAMDGTVVSGMSAVNQAAITGESMPVEKQAGSNVYAGTVNEQGALEIVVDKLAEDSTLAKIMHMVEEAQAKKAPLQQMVDVFAKYYTPAVILAAVALTLVPTFVFHEPFDVWFYRALVLLVISCPCALVISTPVSIVSAIGNASRNGVLIKGGAYLEQMGKIRAVAFDKTGTLTVGKPKVTDVLPVIGLAAEELLRTAAAVEKWSEHPLAEAIVAHAGNHNLPQVTNFQALVGRGAQAEFDGQTVYVGNARLFEELGHELTALENDWSLLEAQGKTVMLVGTDKDVYGMLAVADVLRDNSTEAVAAIKATGVEQVVMLTGDNNRVAGAIAGKLGLDAFYGELLPADKATTLTNMASQYGSVAMVGDGVNDAPALATADVGIAMGVAGSDTALETADIALLSDDLSKLSYVMRLSRKTVSIIKQNISFSLGVKLLFVVATFFGFVNLWLAVLADTGAALLVTLNGMRLVREIK